MSRSGTWPDLNPLGDYVKCSLKWMKSMKCHSFNKCQIVIVAELLWNRKRNETLCAVLLLENNHLLSGNSNSASCRAASYHPAVDHFPRHRHNSQRFTCLSFWVRCHPVLLFFFFLHYSERKTVIMNPNLYNPPVEALLLIN